MSVDGQRWVSAVRFPIPDATSATGSKNRAAMCRRGGSTTHCNDPSRSRPACGTESGAGSRRGGGPSRASRRDGSLGRRGGRLESPSGGPHVSRGQCARLWGGSPRLTLAITGRMNGRDRRRPSCFHCARPHSVRDGSGRLPVVLDDDTAFGISDLHPELPFDVCP